ncbi:hypothetical protein HanRHA438_Chr05g0235651 [Helianthus annuus]|nr:hypothetical protein HanRHA438_Chr05g0235651 [Helianthus annuus]
MQVAMEPFPGSHVLQPNDGPTFYVVSRFNVCIGLRSNNLACETSFLKQRIRK